MSYCHSARNVLDVICCRVSPMQKAQVRLRLPWEWRHSLQANLILKLSHLCYNRCCHLSGNVTDAISCMTKGVSPL